MRRIHWKSPLFAVVALLCAAQTARTQTTGYWKYVRTDSGINSGSSRITDSATGGETALTLTDTAPGSPAVFSVTLYWYSPPSILIPGTYMDWKVSGKVVQNSSPASVISPTSTIINMVSVFCGYDTNPTENCAGGGGPGGVVFYQTPGGIAGNDAVGTVKTSANLQQPTHTNGDSSLYPPTITPGGSAGGMMTFQVYGQVVGGRMWIYHYQYQWVAGSVGSCAGTCTLSSTGQTIAATGGPGSVNVSTSSTFDVSSPDSWITITSPLHGTGNSTVTYTVTANTGTSRQGTILIGGVPFTVSQDGSTSPGGPGTGGQGGVGTTNVALNKPVTVNSKYPTIQGSASSITDGAFDKAWFAYQGAPSYCSIVVDLGQTYSIGRIEVGPQQTFDFQIYGSTDGTTYTQIATQTWPVFVTFPVAVAVNGAASARYIKYEAHTPWAQYIGLSGLRVYEWLTSPPASPDPSAYGTTDLAKGKTVQNAPNYTSDPKNPPANVVDGNSSTAWYGTNGIYLKSESPYDYYLTNSGVLIDLGQSYKIGKVVVTPAQTQGFMVVLSPDNGTVSATSTFLISSDASKFATATYLGTAPQTIYVDGRTSARYVWLYGMNLTPGGTASYPGINEIEVYEFGGSSTPPPTSTCGGTCSINSPGQPIAATGGPGTITVTSSSTWTAVAVDSWIHITSPASNTGNGTVSFTVDANTGPPRNGTISVANLTYVIYQNGTPTGTTSGCAYLIQSSTTQNIPNTGTTSGLIQLITAQNCAWTASTATSWITLRSGTSSTGNGAVAYTVPQNDSGVPRSGGIVIAGQYVVIDQAGGTVAPPPGTPVITPGGVVNTASYAPGGPPNGSLAQGSFFSIYGSSTGPDTPVQASSYPLPATLGGVSVQITQGANKFNAPLVFVYNNQINAILPSSVAVGSAQVTITYNGLTSAPATINVVKTSFGVFFQQVGGVALAIAQNVKSQTDYPLNLPDTPAKPGQIVILWGTGMGPVSVADNVAPGAGDMTSVPVSITVGGVAAQRLYAGRQADTAAVDNIYFTVPTGVTYGCQVPIAITAGGIAANTTNIAITSDGSPCQ